MVRVSLGATYPHYATEDHSFCKAAESKASVLLEINFSPLATASSCDGQRGL
ncbi:hypothetical protein AVEN_190297-1, partial [Araneus ventricosus]